MEDKEYHSNTIIKKKVIESMLLDIHCKSIKYYKRSKQTKNILKILNGITTGLNTISVSSLILMLNPIFPVFMIVALTSTSLSGVVQAILASLDIVNRIHSDNTSYLQYTDLHRNIKNILLRNNMSSTDYDDLLISINDKLGLIEDSSHAI